MDNNLKDRLEKIAASGNYKEPTSQDTVNEAINLLDETEETKNMTERPNYKELLKNEYDSMSDNEIKETRKAAFESVKDDLINRTSEPVVESPTVEEPVKKMSKAEEYERKHSIIQRQEKEVIEDDIDDDPNADLIKSLDEIDKDSAKKSKILHELQEQYLENKTNMSSDSNDSASETVDDILAKIEEDNVRKDLDIKEEEEEDLSVMIDRLESEKLYSKYEEPDDVTGPADYIIEENEEYKDIIEGILDENNIKIVKSSAAEKNAVLNKFSNSGSHVVLPLVNSGIYVTFSGASVPEIIAMNNIQRASNAETTLAKLSLVCDHIIGSSIGKVRLGQLIKVVSYYDIDTLYYGLYAATYPNDSEINRNCTRCGDNYYVKANTRHLLLNSEDFAKEAKDIRDNVTTFAKLRETTILNKVVKKSLMNGAVIVYIKHPSIESFINTDQNLNSDTLRNYQSTLIDVCYSVDKLLLRKSGNEYIEFKDPNTILDVLQKVKNDDIIYELLDAIEEIRPNALPSFGYRKTTCPHCGNVDAQQAFSIQDLLFTSAQQKSEIATLRWAAKLQKRRQQKKK